ncbi:MAG: MucR family transcriptional regulator [Alphaproteobacteria bacterium]|nr:MAG: MucR family transcriptional regulator [Alphaproteobacteria bacterium]
MDDQNLASVALVELTAEISAAYVANNRVAPSEITSLIMSIHSSIASLGSAVAETAKEPVALIPAVPVKKSVTPEYIVCLEDGKHFKSMKRHLATKFGLTPDEYRRKWSLPSDYPMVAAGYAAKRSELALSLGLGRKKVEEAVPPKISKEKPTRSKRVASGA